MTKVAKFRFKKSELGIFNNVDDLTKLIDKSVRLVGFTDGTFSLIDIIKGIVDKIGRSKIIVCTWSAGIKDVNQVRWLLDNDIIESFTLITDHSYVTRQKRYAGEIEKIFGKENIRTSEIHGKFTLIKNDDWSIVIRHSMNLNANRTIETFELDDNLELYNFHYKFINHTLCTMPEGFESRSWRANDSLRAFFVDNTVSTSWAKVGKWE